MFCCSYNHRCVGRRSRHRPASSSSWRARPGPPDSAEPLSLSWRFEAEEEGTRPNIWLKHDFRKSQLPVCGFNAEPVHWGRRDGVPCSSGVLRDIVMWLPPNTSPSPQLTASEASEDPSPLALHYEHFGAQPQLLNNINNNNNNPETFSCNISSRGLFLEETYMTECICTYICFLSPLLK